MDARSTGSDLFLVFSNPVTGQEDEYNTWYDEVHLADVQRVPGIVAARRYDLVPGGEEAPAPAHRYLAVYELDGEPAAVMAELMARVGGPEMHMSPALDMAGVAMSFWRAR